MSKYIPENFKKQIINKLNTIEIVKKILTPEEIEKIIPKFLEFHKNPDNEGKIFNDGFRDWIVFETPTEDVMNKAKPVESNFSDDNYLWVCKFDLGKLSLFASQLQISKIGWESTILGTGKLTRKYGYIGYRGFFKSLEELAKNHNIDVENLTEDDFTVSYSFNLYQLIERLRG